MNFGVSLEASPGWAKPWNNLLSQRKLMRSWVALSLFCASLCYFLYICRFSLCCYFKLWSHITSDSTLRSSAFLPANFSDLLHYAASRIAGCISREFSIKFAYSYYICSLGRIAILCYCFSSLLFLTSRPVSWWWKLEAVISNFWIFFFLVQLCLLASFPSQGQEMQSFSGFTWPRWRTTLIDPALGLLRCCSLRLAHMTD